jgi:hypothetical protein
VLQAEELTVLGHSEEGLNSVLGGTDSLVVKYCTGSRSANEHLKFYRSLLAERFGITMLPGSFNLYSPREVVLPDPVVLQNDQAPWPTAYVSPVVLQRTEPAAPGWLPPTALGFVMRFEEEQSSAFIEVFAHSFIRVRLGMAAGDDARIWLLEQSQIR